MFNKLCHQIKLQNIYQQSDRTGTACLLLYRGGNWIFVLVGILGTETEQQNEMQSDSDTGT